MSQENVDIVRSIYAAWERGDYSSVEWADPNIDFGWADGPTPGRSKGLGEMARAWREFLELWEEMHNAALEYREIGTYQVLVLTRFGGRGKVSGMDLGHIASGASLFELAEGKVKRLVLYFEREHAFVDLGLEE